MPIAWRSVSSESSSRRWPRSHRDAERTDSGTRSRPPVRRGRVGNGVIGERDECECRQGDLGAAPWSTRFWRYPYPTIDSTSASTAPDSQA